MLRPILNAFLLAVLFLLALDRKSSAQSGGDEQAKGGIPYGAPVKAVAHIAKLAKPVDLENGIDAPMVNKVLELLHDSYEFDIKIDLPALESHRVRGRAVMHFP